MTVAPPIRLSMGLVNAYLLRGENRDILVDTGMPGMARRLLRHLEMNHSSPDRLSLIIITHVHFDHVGNLGSIRSLTRAPVLVHRCESALLASGQSRLPIPRTLTARALLSFVGLVTSRIRMEGCTADILADDEQRLEEFGLKGCILHTPGHTGGSLSVILDHGDAVVGDLCQYGLGFGMGMGTVIPPLLDHPELVRGSFQRLLSKGAQRIYPGHGYPFSADAIRARLARWPALS